MPLQYFELHVFASGLFCFAVLQSSDVIWIISLPILVFCDAPNFKFSQKHSQSCMKPLFNISGIFQKSVQQAQAVPIQRQITNF
jgi:hypothetical protein